jgi:hypothetical protein
MACSSVEGQLAAACCAVRNQGCPCVQARVAELVSTAIELLERRGGLPLVAAPSHVSRLLWALGRRRAPHLRHFHRAVFAKLHDFDPDTLEPHDWANVLFAMAALGYHDHALFTAAASALAAPADALARLNAGRLAELAWSVGRYPQVQMRTCGPRTWLCCMRQPVGTGQVFAVGYTTRS